MTLEEWDRQCLGLTRAEYAERVRKAHNRELRQVVLEIAGSVMVIAILAALAWLLAAMPE